MSFPGKSLVLGCTVLLCVPAVASTTGCLEGSGPLGGSGDAGGNEVGPLDGGQIDWIELAERWRAASCHRTFRCSLATGESAHGSLAACLSGDLQPYLERLALRRQLEAAGRAPVVADLLAECTRELVEDPCFARLAACERADSGVVGLGEPCFLDEECASGLYCESERRREQCGACQALPSATEPCVTIDGVPRCGPNTFCFDGFCDPIGLLGEPCPAWCGSGYCGDVGSERQCLLPPAGEGDTCERGQCWEPYRDLGCVDGVCRVRGVATTSGATCGEEVRCSPEYFCNGACRRWAQVGEPCTAICDARTGFCGPEGICVERRPVGGTCRSGPQCAPGLHCLGLPGDGVGQCGETTWRACG